MHTCPPNLCNRSASKVARGKQCFDQANNLLCSHLQLQLTVVPEILDICQAAGKNFAEILEPEPILDIQAGCVSTLAVLILCLEVLTECRQRHAVAVELSRFVFCNIRHV